jgi:carboxypeptidase A1
MAGLLLLLASLAFGRISYEDVQVLQCQLTPALRESFYTVIEDKGLIDVWGISANGTADIMVRNAQEKALVLDFFASSHCGVMIANLEDNMRSFDELQANASRSLAWFDAYHTYSDNHAWWVSLAQTHQNHAIVADWSTKSWEGRAIQTFKINVGKTNKPWIFFQCQIHAREWISSPVCQYVAETLLLGYERKDADATKVLHAFNFAWITNINPDGYVYTWASGGDRQWRKSRRTNTGSPCIGVDLNRNYDIKWGQGGSSTSPCSDTFMGASAGSEPEVKASVAIIQDLQKSASIWMATDVHSYSQLILRPYGWTTANSPNEAQLKQLGDLWAQGIYNTHKKTYTSQKSIDLYVTTGTASDWFYDPTTGAARTNGKQGTNIIEVAGFTVELRPTGSVPGFQLPPAEIIPTCQENYAGLMTNFKWFIDTNKGPLLA